MGKIEKKLMADFVKANKERKEKLAKKFGFESSLDYYRYLGHKNLAEDTLNKLEEKNKTTKKPIKEKKAKTIPTIHNVILLDATGSMGRDKYNNSMAGIKKELDWVKQQTNVNYTYTLREFIQSSKSNNIAIHQSCFMSNPSEVNLNFYGARGGNTPLYKATLDIIEDIKAKTLSTDKILLKVYTDGYNNSLGNFKSDCKELISRVQSENITVTFVGTKADLEGIIEDLGLEESNCLEIENTGKGFEQAMERSFTATQTYSSNVVAGKDVSKGFYKNIK